MTKQTTLLTLCFLMPASFLFGQTFTRITTGPPVTQAGDTYGSSWGDYDNDGDLDLFVTNRVGQNNVLYRNDGDPNGTGQVIFTPITEGPVANDGGDSRGSSSWGDYDNDGDLDLFVANSAGQHNFLYQNNGDGTFKKIVEGSVVNDGGNSSGSSWGDYDNDGDLDLFVANALSVGENNFLYENNGDGTFRNNESSVVTDGGDSQGGSWGDYDNDGDLDLFVANNGDNFLYENNGGGKFTAIITGVMVKDGGFSRGASWGDYDNDGDLDLFVANYGPNNVTGERDFLYRNDGDGGAGRVTFVKITSGPVVTDEEGSTGSSWGDFDNDGDLDLFVANHNNVPDTNNFLYRNDGDPERSGQVIFERTTMDPVVTSGGFSRGSSWCDYDNDGDLDLFVTNSNSLLGFGQNDFLFRNNGNSNGWIDVLFVGTAANRSAIGARVSLKATIQGVPVWQTREISGQTGFGSQNSLNAAFGLGDAARIDSIRVRWPSGIVQDLTNVAVNQFLTITESQFGRVTAGDITSDGGFSFGCSWGDFDQDGDQDLFVPNADGKNNFLYENNGDGSFMKVTTGAIVTDGGNSQSSTWGDYNNDGLLDLFVTNTGNNFLYEGNGDGTFNKVTAGPVVTDLGNSKGCAWGDYDNDGDLDLVVANAGGENNLLYENNGDGSFTKMTTGVIVTDGGDSFGISWSDYDNDGDLDLFIANARDENDFFYENKLSEGLGFIKITDLLFVTSGGDSQGSSWGDYDNDGDLDVLVTRAAATRFRDSGSGYILYRNEGRETSASGVHFAQTNILSAEKRDSFGSSWGDFDNDGDLDLIVANLGDNFLFRNDGDDGFTRFLASDIDKSGGSSIATTWADYNNDGFLDLFVTNLNEDNFLYQTFTSRNHWLKIHLEGRFSNTSAIGTRVRVLATIDGEPRWQIREVSGQTGYFAQNSLNAEFGLADATFADSIIVEWPSGAVNVNDASVPANQFLILQENNRPSIANPIRVTTLSFDTSEHVQDLTAEPPVFLDADRDALIYQAISSDPRIAVAEITSDVLTISLVDERLPGKAIITIRADDGRVDDGRGDTETTLVDVNRNPLIIGTIENQTYVREDTTFKIVKDLRSVFLDPDVGDELVFNVGSGDSSIAVARIDRSALEVSPRDSAGQTIIVVDAADGQGGEIETEFTVRNVAENRNPTLAKVLQDTTLIIGGQPFSQALTDVFADADGDELIFTPVSSDLSVAFATIDGDTLLVEALSEGKATITVRATDGLGGEESINFDVEALPSFRPEIQHAAVRSQSFGQAVAISTTMSDDEGALASATLNYRVAGDAGFVTTEMELSKVSATDYQVTSTIPATAVTDRGLEYFIAAHDTHGVDARIPASGVFSTQVRIEAEGLTKTSAQPSGDEQTSYRLVSVPLELDNPDPESVLADDLGAYDPAQWRLFQWVAQAGGVAKVEFPLTTDLSPGAAVWLIVKSPDKTIDTGPGLTVETSAPFEIPLNAGWNLVGNPFNFPTVAADTLADGTPLQLRSFSSNGWSGQLNPSTTQLQPFEGYAVLTGRATTMFIKPNPSAATALDRKTATADEPALWSIRIRAQCQRARDDHNLAAVAPTGSNTWDFQDHPEPPGVGSYVAVYFPHPEWDRISKRFSTDVRAASTDGSEWELQVESNIRDVVNLSFEGMDEVPSEFGIWLVDKALKITTNLRRHSTYAIAATTVENPKRLTFVVGKDGYLDQKLAEFDLVPTSFELSQNFPNPFNPATTIRYGLPTSSRVTLRIYNILGKEVVTLVRDALQDPGFHLVLWDGRDAAGVSVAAGVYFYRLQAGGFVKTRKLMLLK